MLNLSKEKLLCMMILNDKFAKLMSPKAGEAFFRAFIVQDRETNIVRALFRFKYEGDERSWIVIKPEDQHQGVMESLIAGLEDTLNDAGKIVMGSKLPEDAIRCFYPPDDEGDPAKTIDWLEKEDLIVIAEPIEGQTRNNIDMEMTRPDPEEGRK